MSWFTFHQNNSGGYFKGPAAVVIVQAPSGARAIQIAASHGVYFNGVALGLDCDCCGDRWDDLPERGEQPVIDGLPLLEWLESGRRICSGATPDALVIPAVGHAEVYRLA